MHRLLALALLLLPAIGAAQPFEERLVPVPPGNSYESVEFLSKGQEILVPLSQARSEALPPESPRSNALRVVVYRSEIYQSVVVETVAEGMEGCCTHVTSALAFDLTAFALHFGFKGEVSGFTFTGWSSPTSFRFTYKGQPFVASIRSSSIRVSRGVAANNSFKPNPLRSFKTPSGSSGGSA